MCTVGTAQREKKHLMYIKRPLLGQFSQQVHFQVDNSLYLIFLSNACNCSWVTHSLLNKFLIHLFLDKTQCAPQHGSTCSLSTSSEILWVEPRYSLPLFSMQINTSFRQAGAFSTCMTTECVTPQLWLTIDEWLSLLGTTLDSNSDSHGSQSMVHLFPLFLVRLFFVCVRIITSRILNKKLVNNPIIPSDK